MLLAFLFLSQMLAAQPAEYPSVKFAPRVNPTESNVPDDIEAACLMAFTSTEQKKCIKKYSEEHSIAKKTLFSTHDILICRQLIAAASKKECLELIKFKRFNRSNLSNCIDRNAMDEGRLECLKNKENWAAPASAPSERARR